MNDPRPQIGCRDQCGRTVSEDQLESSGWELLPIQKRYRCPACWRALRQVNQPPQPIEEPTP